MASLERMLEVDRASRRRRAIDDDDEGWFAHYPD